MYVGSRVRLRRTLLGMSQEKLGEILNLTFQQIQKYERGTNRIGASRLWQLVQALDVTPNFFYDGLMEGSNPIPGFSDNEKPIFEGQTSQMTRRETLELVRAYYRITDLETRKRIFEMVKAVGSAAGEEDEIE
jgi:transcriptional regulator with XRE-family HTH domain